MIAVGCSVLDSGALILSTYAFQNSNSGFISLITFMNIVYAFLFDQFLFNESVDTISLLSAITIIIVAISITIYKLRMTDVDPIEEKKVVLKAEEKEYEESYKRMD